MDSIDSITENTGENLFYCKIDTFKASKDYLQGGLCIRFVGIKAITKNSKENDEGVETFIIDIDLWRFAELLYKLPPNRETRNFIYSFEDNPEQNNHWYELRIKLRHHEYNYFYPTFSESPPRFFEIKDIRRIVAPVLENQTPLLDASAIQEKLVSFGDWFAEDKRASQLTLRLEDSYFGGDFVLESFHVGQGMCSIVHNGKWAVLLDMGAGKPVVRPRYPMLSNDLHAVTSKLKSLNLIISHFDSDHWRILAWDANLRAKIKNIYVPSGSRPPAFSDKNIKHKVVQVENTIINLGVNTSLRIHRSIPSKSDSNGDCLVVTFHKNEKIALASGDYCYQRFGSDSNANIRRLLNETYSAVIVPHHGDFESSKSIVSCVPDSPAFFSAGTHQGYNHPTAVSIDEHRAKKFKVIEKRTEENIVRQVLM